MGRDEKNDADSSFPESAQIIRFNWESVAVYSNIIERSSDIRTSV